VTFDSVIQPCSRKEFLDAIWDRGFHWQPGSRGRYEELMSWQGLNELIELLESSPRHLLMYQDGLPAPVEKYVAFDAARRQRLKTAGMVRLLSEGASLVINHVEQLSASLRALAESFEDSLGARTWVNLYAGFRSQGAFALHWDPQDTVILQVSGRKQWKVYNPTRTHPLGGPNRDVAPAPPPKDQPVWAGEVESGDYLYIPRGWWHVAQPLNEPSLHLTVTVLPPTGVDFLQWCIERLKNDPAVRSNLAPPGESDNHQHLLSTISRLLVEQLSVRSLEQFYQHRWAQRRSRTPMQLPQMPYEYHGSIDDKTCFRLADIRALILSGPADGGTIFCHAGEEACECSGGLVPAIEKLTSDRSISFVELCQGLESGSLEEELRSLLHRLASSGLLWMSKSTVEDGG
jgi:hypothetical protein